MQGGAFIATGPTTGLGETVAHKLAAKGANAVINYTRSETETIGTAQACRDVGVGSHLGSSPSR